MSLKIASLVSLLLCVGCRGVARRICYATAPHELDSDGDGLSDVDEVRKHKTDPLVADTDGDGLSDGAEVCEHGTSPTKTDTDGDGLTDGDELTTSWFGLSSEGATDPLNKDTDGDGLSDGDEVTVYATDPTSRDSDDDGLSDGEEVAKYATDPTSGDSNGDGISDKAEVKKPFRLPWCPSPPPPPPENFVDAFVVSHKGTVVKGCVGLCSLLTLAALVIWLVPLGPKKLAKAAAAPSSPKTKPVASSPVNYSRKSMNSDGTPVAPKYEFSGEEEGKFKEVASLMVVIAALFTVHATLSAWAVLARFLSGAPPSEVLPDFFGDPLDGLQFAFFIRAAAVGFAAIERTKGDDIGHLMSALASQRWLWKQMRVPILIKSVKLAASVYPIALEYFT